MEHLPLESFNRVLRGEVVLQGAVLRSKRRWGGQLAAPPFCTTYSRMNQVQIPPPNSDPLVSRPIVWQSS